MNKTDRLLAIVLELQRNGTVRAEDLAKTFETSVRTIYRDVQALSEAGVPVFGAPGIGYSLMEGYFLPPVSFTVEEAVTLLIGTDFIEQKFDTEYGAMASSSRRKIEAILPENVRQEASKVRTTIRLLNAGEGKIGSLEKECIQILRQAIAEERKVTFHYSKSTPETDGNRHSIRVVAPYGLVLVNGSWILIAQCELRNDIRHFRVSRMNEINVLEDRYICPPDFNLQDYQPPDDRNVRVRVLVQQRIEDKVKEAYNFFKEGVEDNEDGVIVTFRVRQPEDLLQWVLGWGSEVKVLEPEALRQLVREEAVKMLQSY